MDSSIKAITSIFVTFVGIVLILSCVSFFMAYNKATSILYSVVQDVEIYGVDQFRIEQYQNENTIVVVEPVESTYGNRYQVSVSFNYVFSFLNSEKQVTISSLTRMVEQ